MMQARGERVHMLRRRTAAFALTGAQARLLWKGCAAFAAAFVLAGVRVLDRHVPAALALTAALPFGLPAVCAYLGAALGYLAFWGLSAAFEPIVAGFLILAEICIFSGLLPRERGWFMPASGALLYAMAGFLHLLECSFAAGETVFLLARLLILAVCCAQDAAALRGERSARFFVCLCLIAGCAAVRPLGMPLGVIPAAGLAFLALDAPEAMLFAAAGGLALDLSAADGVSMTALLCFSTMIARQLNAKPRPVRAGAFLACMAAGVLFTGGRGARLLAGAAIGVALSMAVPERAVHALCAGGETVSKDRLAEVNLVSDVLMRLGRTLGRARAENVQTQSAAIFDRAAEQVCRGCSKWSVCWEARASDTYLALSRSAGRILRRGEALREDLPEAFLAQCTNLSRFLEAVNGALEEQVCRRQYQSRLRESRVIVAGQLDTAAKLLQRAAAPEAAEGTQAVYAPELGYRSCGVSGSELSGDQAASFTCGEWYYLVLCDGMGTGDEAGRESRMAIELLRDLICAGLEAQEALEMLNGIYILRGDGVFSTIDLAQVSLVSGEGFLLKWGAAPSYLRRAQRVVRLGAATLPPGLSAGGGNGAECIRLSLRDGELLVMLSDGADDAQTERRVRSYDGVSAEELAQELIGDGQAPSDDDRTAAVLRLRRIPAHRRGRRATEDRPAAAGGLHSAI